MSHAEPQSPNTPARKPHLTRRILKGHIAPIWAVAFSPDGKTIVSGAGDNTIRLWDSNTGQCLNTFKRHYFVRAVAFSPDGKTIVSGTDDNTIRLWDSNTGQCLNTFKGHTNLVQTVAFSPDGKTIVSGSCDNTILLWDSDTNHCFDILKGDFGLDIILLSNLDGDAIVVSPEDNNLLLWNIRTGQCFNTFKGHTNFVRAVALSPDGKIIVSGADDNTIRLWNSNTGYCLSTLEGHTGSICTVVFSPDGKTIVSGADDNTIRLWDSDTGYCLSTLEGHTGSIYTVAFSPDGKTIVSGSRDNTIRLWDINKVRSTFKDLPEETPNYINAKVLLVGDSGVGKSGLSLRLTENRFAATISTQGAWATHIQIPPAGKAIESYAEQEIWLWDFGGQADYRLIHQLFMDEAALAVVVFDPQHHNPFEGLGQWERDITRAARGAFPKLLVAARIDRGGITVSRKDIEQFCKERGFVGYIETSAQTGVGCKELQAAILENIDWSKVPPTTSPHTFKRLKAAILILRAEGMILLRRSELQHRLEQRLPSKQFTPEQFRAVVGLLAGPGLIWQLDFGDFVLLRPEWINVYAGAMVRQVRAYPGELGCIAEDDLLSGKLDYQDMERIVPDDERIVLLALHQTLLQYGLCLRESTEEGNRLVFPAYFRRERPELTGHPAPIVTFRLNGMLDEIYTTLVVRLHHTRQFETDQLWRNAADFKTLSQQRVGLKLTRGHEGTGEITLYCDPTTLIDTKVAFILYAHEHIFAKATDVTRIRHYACPYCRTPVTNHEAVARRLARGERDIACVDCEGRVPLWDAIEERFASDEMRGIVRKMQKDSQDVLDSQSDERRLFSEVTAVFMEASQEFRETPRSELGLDGEVMFHDPAGPAPNKNAYLKLFSEGTSLSLREVDENQLITFLEGLVAADLSKVFARLPRSINYVTENTPRSKQVAELIDYVRSSAGPKIPVLTRIVHSLFPDQCDSWLIPFTEKDSFRLKEEKYITAVELLDVSDDDVARWKDLNLPVYFVFRNADGEVRWTDARNYLRQSTFPALVESEAFNAANVKRVRDRLFKKR